MPLDPAIRYLIVNADDLGMHPSYDEAIFDAHEHGILTSASLAATGASFAAACERARRVWTLGLGVHLVLHDERPVSDPARVRTLVGPDGRFPGLHAQLRRLVLGRLDKDEVALEWNAQIQKVRDEGLQPDHIDGHCHLHALPSIGPLAHRLARQHGIRCARASEATRWREYSDASPGRWPVSLFITAASRATWMLSRSGLRRPARFVGMVKSGELEVEWLESALRALEPGRVSELLAHPGMGTEPGEPWGDHGPARRRQEHDALVAPRTKELARELGIELVTYAKLAEA
ncbi:MAG: hypothetical protein RIR65_2328 [Planctomycetota bacterium]